MRHPPTITCGRVQPTARNPVSSSAGRAFPSSPASQACAPLLAAGAVPLQAGGPDGGAARSAAALPGPDGSAERTAAALPELDGSAEPTAAAFPRAAAGKPAEIAAVTGPGPDGKLARIPAALARVAAGGGALVTTGVFKTVCGGRETATAGAGRAARASTACARVMGGAVPATCAAAT